MQHEPLFLIVDLFCGFGGTTTGFTKAVLEGSHICKVIACVNHDPKAIKSHWLNHPEVKHFEEDIRTLDLTELAMHVKNEQDRYPNAKLILWASLECTNFSKAKGGQPRDADSRTLADHLFRYQHILNPDYVKIENVVEFMSWGPLIARVEKTEDGHQYCKVFYTERWKDATDEMGELITEAIYSDDGEYLGEEKVQIKSGEIRVSFIGMPESRKNGQDWMRWRNEMCALGYYDEWRELNSADFGAYTSRNRLFGCFAKHGLPIVWPEPTHSKKPQHGMFQGLKKWMPVKEVLDFEDEGESIFNRKKSLSDKTLERIYAGLVKYVAKGDTSFISKYYSGKPAGKNISVEGPAGTVTTVGNQYLVNPQFLLKYNSTDAKGNHYPPSVDEPCPVITTQDRLGVVQPQFLSAYYGNGDNVTSVEMPCPTVPTKDRFGLVQPEYLKSANNQSIHQPAGTIVTNDKHNLVTCEPFIMDTQFNNGPKSIEDPAGVITASRKHHYIVNPSHGGHTTSTDAPCPVIIARQDKAPLYLVQAQGGSVAIAVFDCDTEIMIKIKQFMSVYGLVDIKMRMLRVPELLRIQGFDANYQMVGNQSDHKKFIGNSVHPLVPKNWAEAMGRKLIDQYKMKVA